MGNLLTASEAAKILGVSRQRIKQAVDEKRLPPKYIFNKSSDRKIYIFTDDIINQYLKKETRKKIVWKEAVKTDLLSIYDIIELLGCPKMWIYDIKRRNGIEPSLIVGEKENICFYNKNKVLSAWNEREVKGVSTGYSNGTIGLIKQIAKLNAEGFNDSEIARKTGQKQPRISKLRKDAGLSSVCRRGRPFKKSNKVNRNKVRV